MERRFTYIQPVDSDALEESNRIRMDVTTETEMQQLSSQEDAMSDSSEATLPSSETDAILAIEDGRHASPREEDELSASSEATLPSSEAEAQLPRSEDAVEVGLEAEPEPEPEASARSPRRLPKDGISYNRKAALSSTKVIEWQMNSLPTNPNSPSASKSAGIEGAETEGNSVQISQGGSYPCARCRRTFWSRPNLDAHARVHSGERPFCCAGCGRCFAQACHLRNHEIAAHGRPATPRAFACPVCGCAFGRQGALALHMRVHSSAPAAAAAPAAPASDAPGDAAGEAPPPPPPPPPRPAGPVTCDVCGKTLSHRCSLARHMRTHSGEPRPRPHRCAGCGASFGTAPQLADHERRRHTGERPFACARCARRFHSRAHLKYHERAHDPARPFRCDFCLKAFMSQFGLTRHRRVHTGDFRYKCDECPDAFVSRGQLLAHARNHAGDERPFKCPLCTASFVQRGLLTLHLRKHTGEQPFRCALCAHHFPHRRLLVAHQAVCHKVPSAGSGAPAAAEAASGRSAAAAAATSPADGQTGLSDGPLAPRSSPANGEIAEASMEIQPPTPRDDSCRMEDASPPSPAISTVTVPSVSRLPSSSTTSAHQSTRPVASSPSVSVLTRAKPPSSSRAAPAPTSTSSVAEPTSRALTAASPGRSPPAASSSGAPATPPRPRLLLVAVKTPEKLRLEWGEQPPPKASASDPARDSTSLLREAHRPSGETLASEDDCHHMSHLAAIVKTAACLGDMNSQVIVKIDDEQYPVETFLRTCTQEVNYQCEGLVNDSTSVTNIVNIETHEDEHEMTFKNDTSQWPFESIERTSDVIVKSDEDTIIGSPLSEVVIKVSESDNVVHDVASRNLQEYKAAFKPKIVRVDHTSTSLRNLPVQIEHHDKGDSWPTWPTAVVTIEIEGTDNEDI